MKVLLVNDFKEGGGAENVFRQTAKGASDLEYEVRLFYGKKTMQRPSNPLSYLFNIFTLLRMYFTLVDFRPAIIHIHNYSHVLSPSIFLSIRLYAVVNRGVRPKVVMTVHDYQIVCPNSGLQYSEKGLFRDVSETLSVRHAITKRWDSRGWVHSSLKLLQWVIGIHLVRLKERVDIYVAPSRYMADTLSKFAGISPSRIRILRNPCGAKWQSDSSVMIQEPIRIIFLGRLTKDKGVSLFLNKLLSITSIKYHFTIIGCGEDAKECSRLIEENNAADRVELKGMVQHASAIKKLTEAHVLVLPSIWMENAPLVLVEAAFANKVILTMNYGGMRELADLCGKRKLMDVGFDNLDRCLREIIEGDLVPRNESIREMFSDSEYSSSLDRIYKEK